jgi:zinc transport system substrate-binding protein
MKGLDPNDEEPHDHDHGSAEQGHDHSHDEEAHDHSHGEETHDEEAHNADNETSVPAQPKDDGHDHAPAVPNPEKVPDAEKAPDAEKEPETEKETPKSPFDVDAEAEAIASEERPNEDK